jgi:hypothetical protein
VAIDITGFWRPRLRGCPTRHYHPAAGRALPAIVLGVIARVGSAVGQRLGLPLGLVRADPTDPGPAAHRRRLIAVAAARRAAADVLVGDREFPIADFQAAGVTAWVVRLPKNFTARRASPPPYRRRGRPPTRGLLVRPLLRRRKAHVIATTAPEQVVIWTVDDRLVRAEVWTDLVLPDAAPGSAAFTVVAAHHPAYREPLLLATPLALAPQPVRTIYRDSVGRGATAVGGQADGRGGAPVRACPGDVPAVAGTSAAGRQRAQLCRRDAAGHPDRLLGPPAAADAGPAAAGVGALSFAARCAPPAAPASKSQTHRPPAHGLVRSAATPSGFVRGSAPPRATGRSGLIYRKVEYAGLV